MQPKFTVEGGALLWNHLKDGAIPSSSRKKPRTPLNASTGRGNRGFFHGFPSTGERAGQRVEVDCSHAWSGEKSVNAASNIRRSFYSNAE
jgi:hypothetical protein